ncbi:MFS transporter [Lysobacter arvi]|uniref:MFS transporter n=1 Tax=Lysobacter arvi TaxID=3038776 RepID=A0ABU1CH34_9GAMM|nr:MFS transporter [Lysobacter arvi]MDR0184242.1 MFS transporter [Lysobacter arvi]
MRRAVWLLGLCQCILWGVLYYSFSVLLVPMETALALPRTAVAGAFSVGLLAMAVLAPAVGRWLDLGHAANVTRLGMGLAVLGLGIVATANGAPALYLGWLCMGIAMACVLYEPAFALVIRAVDDDMHRVRALAAVTVMGGLASTIFLPIISVLVEQLGWRAAALVCVGAIVFAALIMEVWVVPSLPASGMSRSKFRSPRSGEWPRHMRPLVAIFASGTLASMALTTLLIPLLLQRGVAPSAAALVLAAFGIAQLPGRVWLLRGRGGMPTHVLKSWPIVFQVAGLIVVIVSASPWAMGAGVAVFGLGSGLHTLSRPWLIQRLYGVADVGRWNGEVARAQGLARAAGPLLMAGAAAMSSAPTVLIGIAGVLAITLPLAIRLPDR